MKDKAKHSRTTKIAPGHRHATQAVLVRCHASQDARGPFTKQTKPFERDPFRRRSLLHSAIYALLTASSLSLLASCAQLQLSRPPKVVSTPPPKPKPKPVTLYQWQGNGRKVSRIEVDLDKQKAFFYAGPNEIGWARVAAGVRSTPTPVGKFKITEKVAKKRSNRYGKIYDSKGNLVIRNAATNIDTIPSGGRFEGTPMPFFMRLTNGGVGLHGGPIPRAGRPASHGCIRLPPKLAPILYQHTAIGTPVRIFGGPSDKRYSGTWVRRQRT
ncbi:L,D-transpeptidase [Candidatus Thiosymbion oneisti]|uniref:L,D-transpeptidase n=1 Tax=Candidatus Thiosymbion oneisti TaxID=589554 RepID=UPI00105EB65A|nr:L,D-transpeptidase [Candidatus Thiosymbion oneisti]